MNHPWRNLFRLQLLCLDHQSRKSTLNKCVTWDNLQCVCDEVNWVTASKNRKEGSQEQKYQVSTVSYFPHFFDIFSSSTFIFCHWFNWESAKGRKYGCSYYFIMDMDVSHQPSALCWAALQLSVTLHHLLYTLTVFLTELNHCSCAWLQFGCSSSDSTDIHTTTQ